MSGKLGGRIAAGGIVAAALTMGAALYYFQVYYYYEDVPAEAVSVALTPQTGGAPVTIATGDVSAIDADSSPLRYRACFSTNVPLKQLRESYAAYENATPLVSPGWFDCYDADEIATALDDGRAQAFLGEADIRYGIDMVVVVAEDGQGWAWHQINPCGEVVFDGKPAPEGCAPPPEGTARQ
ncbi:MAG: DUF6446 family protein [Celeribacter sp.]|jgi:hypothetical protein